MGTQPIRQRYVDQVKLDANGAGEVSFTMRADFLLTQTIWRVTPPATVLPANVKQTTAVCTINGEDWEGTYSGNQDSSGSMHMMVASDVFTCRWTGGDPNGFAQLTLRGVEYPPGTGMQLYSAGSGSGPPVAGSAGPSNPILGGNVLIRTAMQSRNFQAGVAGWQITAAGAAEFNSAVIRGSLSADNGNVLVNDTGVTITGTQQIVTIVDGGLFVHENPDTGSYLQLAAAASFGGLIFLEPDNSITPGVTYDPAAIYAAADETVSASRPFLIIASPNVHGKGHSSIALRGQASDSASDDSFIELSNPVKLGSAVSVSQIGSTTNGTTTSTFFVNTLTTTGIFGAVFIAPPSGAVLIIGRAVGGNNTAGLYSLLDFSVKQNNTIGSGGTIRGTNNSTASVVQSATANNQSEHCVTDIVTGLDPGAVLNVALEYSAPSGGTATYNRRHVTVIPLGSV